MLCEKASICWADKWRNGLHYVGGGAKAHSLTYTAQACKCSQTHLQLRGTLIRQLGELLGSEECEADTSCVCPNNLVNALVERQRLLDPTRPRGIRRRDMRGFESALRATYRSMSKIMQGRGIATRAEVVESYTGAKRNYYRKCLNELNEWGFTHQTFYPAHVKPDERNHRPRAIIPQAAKCLGTGEPRAPGSTMPGETLLLPILVENPVRRYLDEAMHSLRNPDGSRQFASGRSLKQRARDIRDMFPANWQCWSIDCSSYDGSQGELAVLERNVCLEFFRDRNYEHYRELKRALLGQNRLNVRADGIRAGIYGNRASGTAGTSVANKLVMIAALKHAAKVSYDAGQIKFYCDGDDTLLFVAPEAMRHENSWMRRLGRLGLEVVVENRATCFEDIVFCRSKPVETSEGVMLVKMPKDAYKTMCGVVRNFKGGELRDYFATLKDGYGRLWNGVPVMSKIANIFGGGRVNRNLLSSDEKFKWGYLGVTPINHIPITRAARASFMRVFGISHAAQLEIEDLCDQIGELMPMEVETFITTRKAGRCITY